MTLEDATVSDNRAVAVQPNGGGIVDQPGAALRVRDSTLTRTRPSHRARWGARLRRRHPRRHGRHAGRQGHTLVGNRVSLANRFPSPYPRGSAGDNENDACCGAIKVGTGGSLTVRGSRIAGNTVDIDAPLGQPFGTDAALCACNDDVPRTLADSRVTDNALRVRVKSSADAGASGPAAIEADSDAHISHVAVTGNSADITATAGDAAVLGAMAFYFFGSDPPASVADSTIAGNTSTATSPAGSASVQGAGISNNGPLRLSHDLIAGNRGVATGAAAIAQGGGIWNGVLFGGPTRRSR